MSFTVMQCAARARAKHRIQIDGVATEEGSAGASDGEGTGAAAVRLQ